MPEQHNQESLRSAYSELPYDLQKLLPDGNLAYYERTNQMHCGPGEGGSKFEDRRINNILDVIRMYPNLAERVASRTDDREKLVRAGAPEAAFLPANKSPEHPPGLPEALYYKLEGIHGRLGIIQIKDLPKNTRVIIQREKGSKSRDKKDYTPVSFTVVQGSAADMPKTDFATIIVGRDPKENGMGPDEVWTVHPGAPIRPSMKEYDFTQNLAGPEEEGPKYLVMNLDELLSKTDLSESDYIKIVPGDLDKLLEEKK